MIKKWPLLVLAAALLLIYNCGEKNTKKPKGRVDAAASELFDQYPDAALPFVYSDSLFPAAEQDSNSVDKAIFNKYIPDSLTASVFGTKAQPAYYGAGSVVTAEGETYLFTRVIADGKKYLFLNAFAPDGSYAGGLPLFKYDNSGKWKHSVMMDKHYNISKNTVFKTDDGTEISGQDIYVLNNAVKRFTLVMTDSLGDGFSELVNPIDTLSHRQLYTGDYGSGANTLLSFRDGARAGRLRFFIHIENPSKDCVGELKGEAIFKNPTTAEYRQGNDPCVIEFIFDKEAVTLREVQGCGSRLGNIDCKFDGVYPLKGITKIIEKKKAEVKKVQQAKKKADSTSKVIPEPPKAVPPATDEKTDATRLENIEKPGNDIKPQPAPVKEKADVKNEKNVNKQVN